MLFFTWIPFDYTSKSSPTTRIIHLYIFIWVLYDSVFFLALVICVIGKASMHQSKSPYIIINCNSTVVREVEMRVHFPCDHSLSNIILYYSKFIYLYSKTFMNSFEISMRFECHFVLCFRLAWCHSFNLFSVAFMCSLSFTLFKYEGKYII